MRYCYDFERISERAANVHAMQMAGEVASEVWARMLEAGAITETPELPTARAQNVVGVLNEHLRHWYLMLNRVVLPPATVFRAMPAHKPFPPDAALAADACALVQRCMTKPLAFDAGMSHDTMDVTAFVQEQVAMQMDAQSAPITKVKVHGEIVADIERQLCQELLVDAAQWLGESGL